MIHTEILNKIVLFTVDVYIDRLRSEGATLPSILDRMKIGIVGFKRSNWFTDKEAKLVVDAASDPELEAIIRREISHLVFILTVIKIWVETVDKKDRPLLNISDKKLAKGKAEYALHMLKLKQRDSEDYKKKKEIIDYSVETAEQFMEYHLKLLTYKEEDE